MTQLLTYPSAFGRFSSSPFCIKAAHLLTMAGVPWEREDTVDPRKLPYGKLPAIRVDGDIIADSDAIRAHLEENGTDFDNGLTKLDRANARAFIRMAEEHIYFHVMLDRWGNDDTWPVIVETYFGTIPRLMRGIVASRLRRQVLAGLKTQGLGRFPESERLVRLETDLKAICARLLEKPFLFSQVMTAADASVAPMLACALATPGETRLARMIAQNDRLTDYIERVNSEMANAGCV